MKPRAYMRHAEALFLEGLRLLGVDEPGDPARAVDVKAWQRAHVLFAGSAAAAAIVGATASAVAASPRPRTGT